ncbi:hypothetical protein [Mesorhizobium sp. J18]|uniref:hypothetical protein n=1 Tax=Mesorhizobium sp. J18 TaxID=935263 RepID=UPI0011A55132|nr:hypothetical protein [Mesorhizobium sp. J18]
MARRVRINPPTNPIEHPDYLKECQFALEPSITKLIELASDAGWDRNQAAVAIMFLGAASASDEETTTVASK